MVICYSGHRKLICPDQETDTVEHREAAVGTTQPTELVPGGKPAVPAPSLGAAGVFFHPDPDDAPSLDQTEPSKQPRSDKPRTASQASFKPSSEVQDRRAPLWQPCSQQVPDPGSTVLS